jgi:hypothetical protein
VARVRGLTFLLRVDQTLALGAHDRREPRMLLKDKVAVILSQTLRCST